MEPIIQLNSNIIPIQFEQTLNSDSKSRSDSSLNQTLPSDSVVIKEKSYANNESEESFISQSVVKSVETHANQTTSGTTSIEKSNSISINERQELYHENETIIRFESKVENGELGSRTSPLRTYYKKSTEKRQTTSVVSPTSPVRGSLIPRYVANNTPNQNPLQISDQK